MKLVNLLTAQTNRYVIAAFVGVIAVIGFVYQDVLVELGRAWYTDDNYSRGFLIAPLAGFCAWERRRELPAHPIKPSWLGLVIIAGSLVLLIGGTLGAEFFLSRVSLIGVLAGTVLFLFGW